MHIVILNVFNVCSISVMSKSCKTSSIEVGCQGSITCNKAINTHVKLLATYQKRIDDITLHNVGLSLGAFWFPSEIVFPLGDLLKFIE
jgi:hypothetical protein